MFSYTRIEIYLFINITEIQTKKNEDKKKPYLKVRFVLVQNASWKCYKNLTIDWNFVI